MKVGSFLFTINDAFIRFRLFERPDRCRRQHLHWLGQEGSYVPPRPLSIVLRREPRLFPAEQLRELLDPNERGNHSPNSSLQFW